MEVNRIPEVFTDNRDHGLWEQPLTGAAKPRKVVLIGGGMVGQAFIYSCMNQGVADIYGIIDIFADAAYGNELDFEDAIPALPQHCTVRSGGYELMKGADVVVISAGRPQKPGETRLQMVQDNAKIMRTIATEVKNSGFDGITVCVANPVDVMTMVYLQHTGFDPRKVISSGTLLDSSRLQFELSKTLKCKPADVECYILGEHGDSSIATFEHGKFGGESLLKALAAVQEDGDKTLAERCENCHTFVFKKAYEIINRKRFTNYGIGACAARLANAILNNQEAVVPVGVLLDGEYGQSGVISSVLACLGRGGVSRTFEFPIGKVEQEKFENSCKILSETYFSTFEGNKESGVVLADYKGWSHKK